MIKLKSRYIKIGETKINSDKKKTCGKELAQLLPWELPKIQTDGKRYETDNWLLVLVHKN